MSLSECQWCGGSIPLGPDASNVCSKCGKPVMSGPALVTCEWRHDEDSDSYDTTCGGKFQLSNSDGLEENGMRFCCYCGKPIEETT